MLKISTKIEYGLVLLIFLAKNQKRLVSLKEVARTANLPMRYLGQIAGLLSKAAIIKAKEGKSGGYQLVKKIDSLTLGEIINSLEGPVRLAPCVGKKCSQKNCLIKNFWFNLDNLLKKEFEKVKLSQLI